MLLLLLDGSPPPRRLLRRLLAAVPHPDRCPAFVSLGAGATAAFVVPAVCVHATVGVPLALLVAVVAVVGWTGSLPAAGAVAGIAWLNLTAFDVVGDGVLRLPTAADRDRLLVLAGVAVAGWLAREVATALSHAPDPLSG